VLADLRDGCDPGGENGARSRAADGDAALFAQGQVLRVLVARWILLREPRPALSPEYKQLCVLGHCRGIPTMLIWNGAVIRSGARDA
jgi:hypothetical protein